MAIKIETIVEACLYFKITQTEPCVICGTLTPWGICPLCQTILIDKFCKALTDNFLWSKHYRERS